MKFKYILLTIISLIVAPIGAQVSLPKVFADNMMFQRNKPIKIWGAASKGEAIQIVFNNATKKTKADKNGKWRNADLPFYWVQLANFMAKDAEPTESAWPELREAQDMALVLPHTGQAVITDIGDANDIHPRNKQDVGLRLALIALNKDYAKENEYSGSRYLSHTIETNKIIVQLSNAEELNLTNKV